jgi:capsular exopolysaccharide synthesis family protein
VNLPAPVNPSADRGLVPFEPRVDDGEPRIGHIVAMLKRYKWLILGCAAASSSAAAIHVRKAVPVYSAAVTLRIEGKQPDGPDVWRAFSQTGNLNTEIEVVGSRTLAEDATRILGLQVRLTHPRNVARDRLLTDIQVTPDAPRREYTLTRQDNGFEVSERDGARLLRTQPGEQLRLPGVTLRLTPEAMQYPELRVVVRPFSAAVGSASVAVARLGNERDRADVIRVSHSDTDQGLAWKVPNVIAERFIERRQETQKIQTRSQAKFLREQIDTLAIQLARSEEELKKFQERARVVSPTSEASSQIDRLVHLQADRSAVEAERSALASLVAEVEERHKQQTPGKPSVYRELLAFPSLLRNPAASQLLNSLSQVEDQRATLLTRRTEADPDVQLLSKRIAELENQLSTMAGAYLKGLSNQVNSLDAAIAGFGRELNRMPSKELEFARLERKPQVLKDLYALMQTRLKEAEIAEAAVNSTVTIVDPAIPPTHPMETKGRLFLLTSLVGGTLLGIGLGMIREYTDRSIKTRSHATAASGLPVMAIVPRIQRQGRRSAIIARRSTLLTKRSTSVDPKGPPPSHQHKPAASQTGYTFLSGLSPEENSSSGPETRSESHAMVSSHPPARMSLSRSAGAVAEAYAILQTNIAFSRPEEHIKVLALTSALPGEGKTTTAVNLALTMCQRGLSVCIIDADLRRPQLHEIFHLTREPGLAEVLRGLQTFEGAYRPVQIGEEHRLAVLTAGSHSGSAPALVGSARMRTLLSELREQFDLVILDTPPVNILTDAALLGVNADGVIVVVRAGSTDAAALQYAIEQLKHVRAPALGIVMNDVDLKRYGAYDGAYRYYTYSSAYTDATPSRD